MNIVNPFLPGDGQVPPHLAGREAEQGALRQYLPRLQGRQAISGNVALVGPRGNGKTALLRWFEREVRETNGIDVVWLTPDDMPDLDKLATSLVSPRRFASLLPDTLSLSIGAGRMGWELGGQPMSLTELLTARCLRQPLVVLLDEAHTLDPAVGKVLLNASQKVRSAAPFLLALAGTPGLREHLNNMSVTFWNRCEKLGIGRLTREATRAALIGPDEGAGASLLHLTQDALDEVVTESQCYPYFIQLWGAALWDRAQECGPASLDVTEVARVRPVVAKRQDAYYQDRYAELKNRKLLDAAGTVAAAFVGRSVLSDRELDRAIAGEPVGLDPPDYVLDTCQTLRELGYVWQAPARNDWEPGIPDLMEYVRVQAT